MTVVDRSCKQQQPQPLSCFQFDPPKPPSGGGGGTGKLPAPSPPVSAGAGGSGPGPGGFRFNQPSRPPTLPPRPPPTATAVIQPYNYGSSTSPSDPESQPPPGKVFMATTSAQPSTLTRVTCPPSDLPGLPPRPPAAMVESGVDRSNSSSVARLAQMFGTQLSPAKYEITSLLP